MGDEQPSVYPIGPEDKGAVAVWQKGLQTDDEPHSQSHARRIGERPRTDFPDQRRPIHDVRRQQPAQFRRTRLGTDVVRAAALRARQGARRLLPAEQDALETEARPMTPRPRSAHRAAHRFPRLRAWRSSSSFARSSASRSAYRPVRWRRRCSAAHKLIHCPSATRSFPSASTTPPVNQSSANARLAERRSTSPAAPVKSGNRIVVLKGTADAAQAMGRRGLQVHRRAAEVLRQTDRRPSRRTPSHPRRRNRNLERTRSTLAHRPQARRVGEGVCDTRVGGGVSEGRSDRGLEPIPTDILDEREWRVGLERSGASCGFRRLSSEGKSLLIGDDLD